MVSQNQTLNNHNCTVDSSEEVRIELKFLKTVDGLKSHGLLNLNFWLLFLCCCFALHTIIIN